jgi:hypothetical protein
MRHTSPVAALVIKEIRGLLAAWLVCLTGIVAARLAGSAFLGAAIFLYVAGSAALGAQSIGQEYANRTLATLLTQPVTRRRLLSVKLFVLAALLLTLTAAAEAFVFSALRAPRGVNRDAEMTALLWAPLLCAVSLAPWLTMVCRSAVAGAVFTMALPGLVLVAGELAWNAAFGPGPVADWFRLRTFWGGIVALCLLGGGMSVRTFGRLEVIEGGAVAFSAPWPSRVRRVRLAHPLWLLVKKEIRLQQMALSVGALYLVGGLMAIALRRRIPDEVIGVLSFFYAASIPPLVGSAGSAEERQLGTLDWQLLLPIAAWKQWTVKVAVALAVAIGLSLGLPVLLLEVDADARSALLLVPVVFLTVVSLYISSLWSNGLWAFLTSAIVAIGLVPLVTRVYVLSRGNLSAPVIPGNVATTALALLLAGGYLFAVLALGLDNHRAADRTVGRIWKQLFALVGCLVFAIVTWMLVVVVGFGR